MLRTLSHNIQNLIATLIVATLSMAILGAFSKLTLAQSEEPYPPAPVIGAYASCSEPTEESTPVCQQWLKDVEAWKQRQKTRQRTTGEPPTATTPSVTGGQEEERSRRYRELTRGLKSVNRFEVVAVSNAAVRELPESGAKRLQDLTLGEQVNVIGVLPSGWVEVAREGSSYGWLHRSALSQQATTLPPARADQTPQIAPPVVTPKVVAAPADVANRPIIRGRNYALIIGNNNYENLPRLNTSITDAAALAELLKLRYSFESANVKLLINANRRSILTELKEARRRLNPEDRLLIYYGGHGQIDPVTEEGFWQPVDAEVDNDFTWIANSDIRRSLRGIPAKHVLVIADSCFSGTLTRGREQYAGIPQDRFFTEIDSHVSRTVISSGGTEPVADAGSGGHSVFAFYLLKALRENRQPFITSFELFNKLVRAVTNNSNQKPQFGTVSEAGDEGSGDFTFILRSGG